MSLLNAFQWRYATKTYDTSKKLSTQQVDDLLAIVQLSPSSYGLQPYKIFIIDDQATLEQISRAAFGQPQITTGARILVITVETNIDENTVKAYIDKAAAVRNTDRKNLEPREQFVNSKLGLLSPEQKTQWAEKQAYLAVGVLVSAAAEAGIDASPMEGFDRVRVDEILGLGEKHLRTTLLFALGYRSADDEFARIPKVRKTRDELVGIISSEAVLAN